MHAPIADARNPDGGVAFSPVHIRSLTACLQKASDVQALDAATNVLRVLATMSVLSMLKRNLPARQVYVAVCIGEPLGHVLHDIAILHVREFFPHPPSRFRAMSNPHPLVPTGYTSLVSLKSVRGEGAYVIPCGGRLVRCRATRSTAERSG